MPQLARVGDDCGGVIITGANSVLINSRQAAYITSEIAPHSSDPTHVAKIITGSQSVFIEGKCAAYVSSKASCFHSVLTGSENVFGGG